MKRPISILLGLFAITLMAVTAAAAATAAVVLFEDPFELLRNRKSLDGEEVFIKDMRLQAPGAIRKYFLRSNAGKVAIVGSSNGEFLLPSDVEDIIGLKGVYSFAMVATSPLEVFDQLRLLERSESLTTVICTIDRHYYFFEDATYAYRFYRPEYYRDGVVDRLRYALDKQAFLASWSMLWGSGLTLKTTRLLNQDALERTASAMQDDRFDSLWGRGQTLKTTRLLNQDALERTAWTMQDGRFDSDQFSLSELREKRELSRQKAIAAHARIEENRESGIDPALPFPVIDDFVTIIAKRPDIRFILYVSPWAHLHEGISTFVPPNSLQDRDGEMPYQYYYGMKYLVDKLKHMENVTVFALDDQKEIVENYANYGRDPWHPVLGVPRYFLYSVREGKHIITTDNIDAYLERTFDIWVHGQVYIDETDTVGYEGPVDTAAYSRYPYRRSKYALETDTP